MKDSNAPLKQEKRSLGFPLLFLISPVGLNGVGTFVSSLPRHEVDGFVIHSSRVWSAIWHFLIDTEKQTGPATKAHVLDKLFGVSLRESKNRLAKSILSAWTVCSPYASLQVKREARRPLEPFARLDCPNVIAERETRRQRPATLLRSERNNDA